MDLAHRRAGRTFCPSEAARVVADDWRVLMPRVRMIAAGLPLSATRKGEDVDPVSAKGPIRLRLAQPSGP